MNLLVEQMSVCTSSPVRAAPLLSLLVSEISGYVFCISETVKREVNFVPLLHLEKDCRIRLSRRQLPCLVITLNPKSPMYRDPFLRKKSWKLGGGELELDMAAAVCEHQC